MSAWCTKLKNCKVFGCLIKFINCKLKFAETWLYEINILAIRMWMAFVFWRSADTKVTGEGLFGLPESFSLFGIQIPLIPMPYEITDTTYLLFEYEYAVPFLSTDFAAISATFAEVFLSLMILFGFGGRVAAVGFFVMTLVIHFTYEMYNIHYVWMMLLAVIITKGPGLVSVDALIRKKYNKCADMICQK